MRFLGFFSFDMCVVNFHPNAPVLCEFGVGVTPVTVVRYNQARTRGENGNRRRGVSTDKCELGLRIAFVNVMCLQAGAHSGKEYRGSIRRRTVFTTSN